METRAGERDPDPEQLLELFKVAVDEYRFQVDLSWRRSQYLFALNAAVLAAGVGILATADPHRSWVGVLPFLAGLALAMVSAAITATQHDYYRASRAIMLDLERRLGGTVTVIATTPGQGSRLQRRVRVTTLQYLILGTLGLADMIGALFAILS